MELNRKYVHYFLLNCTRCDWTMFIEYYNVKISMLSVIDSILRYTNV